VNYRNELLDEAEALIGAIAPLALEYQSYVGPGALLRDGGNNLQARLRVSREWDKVFPRPRVVERKLEMAGYDDAASALSALSDAVFYVTGWIEMSWEEDETDVLAVDVHALRDAAIDECRALAAPPLISGVVVVLTWRPCLPMPRLWATPYAH
jgi:hypothetical protein